jgi:hypothetical protein
VLLGKWDPDVNMWAPHPSMLGLGSETSSPRGAGEADGGLKVAKSSMTTRRQPPGHGPSTPHVHTSPSAGDDGDSPIFLDEELAHADQMAHYEEVERREWL